MHCVLDFMVCFERVNERRYGAGLPPPALRATPSRGGQSTRILNKRTAWPVSTRQCCNGAMESPDACDQGEGQALWVAEWGTAGTEQGAKVERN